MSSWETTGKKNKKTGLAYCSCLSFEQRHPAMWPHAQVHGFEWNRIPKSCNSSVSQAFLKGPSCCDWDAKQPFQLFLIIFLSVQSETFEALGYLILGALPFLSQDLSPLDLWDRAVRTACMSGFPEKLSCLHPEKLSRGQALSSRKICLGFSGRERDTEPG